MSSFATLFGLAKMSGGNFRIGLSNDQYLFLSEIFPYFEEHAKDYVIEGCRIFLQLENFAGTPFCKSIHRVKPHSL